MKEDNFIASFPCSEAATRFAFYVSKKGYKSRIEKYDSEKRQGYYKVTYWKEDNDESQD